MNDPRERFARGYRRATVLMWCCVTVMGLMSAVAEFHSRYETNDDARSGWQAGAVLILALTLFMAYVTLRGGTKK